MKTGKSRQRDARYLCKVYANSWPKRLIWWAFRKYLLNEDHWKVHMLFSGPRRDSMACYCLKADAVATRMYIDVRHQEPTSNHRVMSLVDRIDRKSKEMTGRRIDF